MLLALRKAFINLMRILQSFTLIYDSLPSTRPNSSKILLKGQTQRYLDLSAMFYNNIILKMPVLYHNYSIVYCKQLTKTLGSKRPAVD